MPVPDVLPSYDELPEIEGLGLRHAWDVFGRDDRLGSINLVTPERVARAAALVRTGELVPLDLPLDLPDPPLFGRKPYAHVIGALNRHEMDDHLDGFHPQASTQWDALAHVRCREHGYWGGRTQDPTDGDIGLGIENIARHGLAGRGVLVDVAGWYEAQGRPVGGLEVRGVTADEVQAVLDAQRVTFETGDIVLLRFGWPGAYKALDVAERTAYAGHITSAGLLPDEAMARFVWNVHPAALAADNPAIEMVPGDPKVGSLHRRLLPTLGIVFGEMFDLDRLAVRCRELDRWTFFFVAAPLHLPGGIGSPGNAVAIL